MLKRVVPLRNVTDYRRTTLTMLRRAALAAISILIVTTSAVSFAESYHGLLLWANGHGLTGPWWIAWPLQIDVFIAVGELALFVARADGWAARSRAAAWTVTLLSLAASVAANVGHVAGHDLASRATAAVPPLAASAALAVGLGVLKRVVASRTAIGMTVVPAVIPVSDPDTKPVASRTSGRPAKRAKTAAKAAVIVARTPVISGAELGRKLEVSKRTGRRLLASVTSSS